MKSTSPYQYKNDNRFPIKLFQMLEEVSNTSQRSVICWVPTNDAFQVNDAEYLVQHILPNYFNRKLNCSLKHI